jgi:phospholipid/cholesterol/gamma-HCH transport system substrate-binding protein
MILTNQKVCHQGYESTDTRPPHDGSNRPMNVNARCAEPAAESNARGAQHAPERAAASYAGSASSPVVAAYDPSTGHLTWGDKAVALIHGDSSAGSDAPPSLGEESWKWLFLQPLTSGQ